MACRYLFEVIRRAGFYPLSCHFCPDLGFTAAYFRPVHTPFWAAALVGVFIAGVAIAIETRIRRISLERLLGIAGGATIGLIGAALVSLVLGRLGAESSPTLHFVQVICLLLLVYFGAVTGAAKGRNAESGRSRRDLRRREIVEEIFKILDTSVIIDGRIADIAETGFLDGVLVIPQFVLRELQTGGRFRRFDEAQSRPPRARHPAAHPEDGATSTCRSWRRISRRSAKST